MTKCCVSGNTLSHLGYFIFYIKLKDYTAAGSICVEQMKQKLLKVGPRLNSRCFLMNRQTGSGAGVVPDPELKLTGLSSLYGHDRENMKNLS